MDYSGSWEEFVAYFGDDDDCRDYLDWLQWPNGFACSWCATTSGWQRVDGRWDCGGCGRVVSQTAGAVFDYTPDAAHLVVFDGVAYDESRERLLRPWPTTRTAPRLPVDRITYVAPAAIGDGVGRPDAPTRQGRGR
ncbi:MAG: transposase [Ferrimicrobium sp.]